MLDDTIKPDAASPVSEAPHGAAFCLKSNITDILSHSAVRSHADLWSRNLRFLTFDDDSKTSAYAEDVEPSSWTVQGQCRPCEDRLPAPNGHICAEHTKRFSLGTKLLKESNTCVHVQDRTCDYCIAVPLFPNHGKVTRFRIRRLHRPDSKNLSYCNHFIAASYCWSSQVGKRYAADDNADKGPYQVIEEDGSRRDMRANPYTIDRLVAFARDNGFRMIWIDHECIEQEDLVKTELAIQAMDLVYSRSDICVGLMEAELEQEHLDCLLIIFERLVSSRFKKRQKRRGVGAFNGCRRMRSDVLGETISRIVNDRWNTRAWILQEAFASSGRMVLLFPRAHSINVGGWFLVCHELSRSELAIELDIFQACLAATTSYAYSAMQHALEIRRKKGDEDQTSNSTHAGLGQRYKPLAEQSTEEIRLTMARLRMFHPRGPTDGMIVSMNKNVIRRTCNAAMSLTYLQLRGLTRVCDKLAIVANLGGYTLRLNTHELEKTQTSLSLCVHALALANGDFSLLTPELYSKSLRQTLEFPQGETPEFSWVHLSMTKLQHVESMTWNPGSNLSMGNVGAIVDVSERGLSVSGFLWKIDDFIPLKSFQVKYADSWRRLTASIEGGSSTASQTIKKATTHILFELIQQLASTGHNAVANAIWNSTANWQWNQSLDSLCMLEKVDQFPQGLQVENEGGHGGIRVASAFLPAEPGLPDLPHPSPSDISVTDGEHDIKHTHEESHHHELRSKETEPWTHSRYMLSLRLTSMMFETIPSNHESEDDFGMKEHLFMSPENLSMFIHANGIPKDEWGDIASQRAIFDVEMPDDGQEEWVLSPFQMELESLPRPERRACSVSWTIEPVSLVTEESEQPRQTFRTRQMVRGMWQFKQIPQGRYNLV
ncbi:hypothetical protein PG987_001923 [Apiospora arundinis]